MGTSLFQILRFNKVTLLRTKNGRSQEETKSKTPGFRRSCTNVSIKVINLNTCEFFLCFDPITFVYGIGHITTIMNTTLLANSNSFFAFVQHVSKCSLLSISIFFVCVYKMYVCIFVVYFILPQTLNTILCIIN